jgi:geranylgeranyl reductase family protein
MRGPGVTLRYSAGYRHGVDRPPEVWDVAVIGAGPAGAMAALAAVARQQRVVVLERFRIPRHKTCAGGLVGASLRALPAGLEPPVKTTVTSLTFSLRGKQGPTRSSKAPLVRTVQRDEFDAMLIDAAVAAGAVVRDGAMVTGLTAERDDLMRISVRNEQDLCARVVVGADGSAGRSAAYVGVTLNQVDLGLEVELPTPSDRHDYWRNRILIDWGTVPGGYAWVFPKGDFLSVGVIAERGTPQRTRAYLDDFLSSHQLDPETAVVSSGHLTRCRTADSPLFRDRVLVAGDAAGLLDPWTREGISFALRSGTMAGQAAASAAQASSAAEAAAALGSYADQVSATLAPEMQAGGLFLRAYAHHPRAFFLAMRLFPVAWKLVVRAITGEANLADMTKQPLGRLLLMSSERIRHPRRVPRR